jgi:hypothetical protein
LQAKEQLEKHTRPPRTRVGFYKCLADTTSMQNAQLNIERINDLWRLHEHRDLASPIEGRCLMFVTDRRYIEDEEDVELRLGVSFGHNVVNPDTKQGFIGIPVHPGQFVFGFHLIGIKGTQLTLYDQWMDAQGAGDCTDATEGEKVGRSILDAMSDDVYLRFVRSSREDTRPLKTSNRYLLEEFEVIKGEAF